MPDRGPGRAGQQRQRLQIGEVAGRVCRPSRAERMSRAAGSQETEDLVLERDQFRAGRAEGWGVVESGAAAGGQGPAPAGIERRPALGGVERACAHRGEHRDGCAEVAAVGDLAAFRAAVFEEPLVQGAGEDDGQVPDLAPWPAEGVLNG